MPITNDQLSIFLNQFFRCSPSALLSGSAVFSSFSLCLPTIFQHRIALPSLFLLFGSAALGSLRLSVPQAFCVAPRYSSSEFFSSLFELLIRATTGNVLINVRK